MKRLRTRDWRFLLLVLVHAVCIFGFVSEGLKVAPSATGGWRALDLGKLESRIRAGDLVEREADWYRVLPETERAEPQRERGEPQRERGEPAQ